MKRIIEKTIHKRLFKGKAIVLLGPRQVGKTTLVKKMLEETSVPSAYYSCDEPDIRSQLTDVTSSELKAFFGKAKLIVLDEAQRVRNIGITLKLLVDNFPDKQVIATGSSSFDLSNKIIEPLTGRQYEFRLYPVSLEELEEHTDEMYARRTLERRLIFGMYPEPLLAEGSESEGLLKQIASDYLYKDVLLFEHILQIETLDKLLKALALQLGNEVSYTELGQVIGSDYKTVQKYIGLLEKAFIIFRLPSLSRNRRNELKKARKVYFYDNGIRNALINNFNALDLRNDVGALWENFLMSERVKYNSYHQRNANAYFWRTHSQQEIDYIEEYGGRLHAFEFKWKDGSYKTPREFTAAYPNTDIRVISREQYRPFIITGEM